MTSESPHEVNFGRLDHLQTLKESALSAMHSWHVGATEFDQYTERDMWHTFIDGRFFEATWTECIDDISGEMTETRIVSAAIADNDLGNILHIYLEPGDPEKTRLWLRPEDVSLAFQYATELPDTMPLLPGQPEKEIALPGALQALIAECLLIDASNEELPPEDVLNTVMSAISEALDSMDAKRDFGVQREESITLADDSEETLIVAEGRVQVHIDKETGEPSYDEYAEFDWTSETNKDNLRIKVFADSGKIQAEGHIHGKEIEHEYIIGEDTYGEQTLRDHTFFFQFINDKIELFLTH